MTPSPKQAGAPEGNLTRTQYEILDAIWSGEEQRGSVAEIWKRISKSRSVGRTTILNLVDRLEKRGWLERVESEGTNQYRSRLSRDEAEERVAETMVDEFFGGSARKLVARLLGSKKLSAKERRQLKELVDAKPAKKAGGAR